jgi:hypothetical protein
MKILRLVSLSLVTMVMIPMGVNAHCTFDDPPHPTGHRHCDAEPPGGGGGGGGGGNGKDAFYTADISGAVSGDEGSELWHGNFGGKSRIGRNTGGHTPVINDNAGELTLSFFTMAHPLGPFSIGRGLACFNNGGVLYMGQTIVRSGKHGQAEGSFFFKAKAEDGTTDVGYLLTMIGTFTAGVWPPSPTTTMTLDTWTLTAGNEDSTVRNISCLGDGEFSDFSPENGLDDDVTIVVTLDET